MWPSQSSQYSYPLLEHAVLDQSKILMSKALVIVTVTV